MVTRTITEAGVYDLPAEVYHADPVAPEPSLSAGTARTLVEATPLHAWTANERLNPEFERTENSAFDVGSAAHMMLTGRGAHIHEVDAPDWRSKAAKEEREYAYARGMTPLLVEQAGKVRTFVRSCREQMRAHGIGDPFDGGDNEKTLVWRSPAGDRSAPTRSTPMIWSRAMVDCIDAENRIFYDYKTTAAYADPERWIKTGMDTGIDLRVAHYLEGASRLLGPGWRYRLVIQEKAPPYALCVLELDQNTVEIGARKLGLAKMLWRRSLDTGVWPGWTTEIVPIGAPPFYEARWMGRETSGDDHRKKHPSQAALDAAREMMAPI